MPTCDQCCEEFEQATGRGRPRKRCLTCAPPQVRAKAPVAHGECPACGTSFPLRNGRRWCSYECRQTQRMAQCAECGKAVYKSGTSARVQVCLACRRARVTVVPDEHWACARCGAACSRPRTKGQKPKFCTACRTGDWISPKRRHAIYERDSWQCWLCLESVDASLIGSRSPWRPSLDHVIPRAHGGADDESNLRLAHLWCNCTRSDGKYQPEDFRVRAA